MFGYLRKKIDGNKFFVLEMYPKRFYFLDFHSNLFYAFHTKQEFHMYFDQPVKRNGLSVKVMTFGDIL